MLRLFHPRLTRAFPELDALSSVDRQKVVRWALRARGTGRLLSPVGRWVPAMAVALTALGVGAAHFVQSVAQSAGWAPGDSIDDLWRDFSDSFDFSDDWMQLLLSLVPAVLAFALSMRLLKRAAVRRVLARRGRCDRCGYTVAGMPVDDGERVRCPECSCFTEVAPSIGEVRDGVFRPRTEMVAAQFWTARRVARAALGVAALLAVVGGVWGGRIALRAWRIHADAKQARADRVTLQSYNEQFPSPPFSPDAPNAFELAAAMKAGLAGVQDEVRSKNENFSDTVFDPTYLIPGEYSRDARNVRDVSFTQDVLVRWIDGPGRKQLDAFSGQLGFTRPVKADAEGVVTDITTSWLADTRYVMRLYRQRAWAAWRAHDPVAWREAAHGHLNAARAAEQSPTMIGKLVTVSIESSLLSDIRRHLLDLRERFADDAPTVAWLNAFDDAIAERVRTAVPLEVSLRGERLFARTTIANAFADVDGVKAGKLEEMIKPSPLFTTSADAGAKRVGRYTENREALDRYFERLTAAGSKRRGDRPDMSVVPTGLGFVDTMQQAADRFLTSVDQVEQYRTAVATMVAIERHHRMTGSYPATLAGLERPPVTGAAMDLFNHDRPLVYRLAPRADGRQALYVLYSVGVDGVDDGGKESMSLFDAFSPVLGKGKDAVFTIPEPSP